MALVVLGMHRSGTSALARVLSLRGAALPRRLLPANAGNDKGYWEPERIVELNERILRCAGLAWNDAFAAEALAAAGPIAPGFLEEARAVVAEEYGDAPLIVLKDPRCTLLQAFWHEALAGLGIAMLPVVIARPPGEVVASLVRRDGGSAVGAGLLYVAYGTAAARTAPPAAFLTYAQLLDDWRGQTGRLAAELGFQWPALTPAAERDIDCFLGRGGAPASGHALPAGLAALCDHTWQCLSALASGKACDAAQLDATEAALSRELEAARPLLRDKNLAAAAMSRRLDAALAERDRALAVLARTEEELRKAQADHARAAEELGEARVAADTVVTERDTALRERDEALALYRKTESELRKAQADFAAVTTELGQARASGEQAVRERDAALGERDRALGVLGQAERALGKARADHATAAAERDALQEERDALQGERDALQGERDALQGERDALQGERDALLGERDRLLALYRQTDALMRKAQGDFAAMEQRAEMLDAEYRRMAGFARDIVESRSWRLTRPLRALTRKLHGHAGADPALPEFGGGDIPASWSAPPAGGEPASAGEPPRPTLVPQSLNDFLFDEFGPEAAADVTGRIRHYHLPVDTREVRAASALDCSEAQALAWARALSAKPRPHAGDAPDVSIVVPVYNQVAFTLAAIDSLLSHGSRYTFEILVGDDASTDATAAALAEPIPGVRHVRHERNLGFVRNCNATARHARGRYVLFLNNDTQVLPGWLDELVGTLEDDPQVGLAGSKLVYPDGRLQECGAIVWRDGSAWNFGRLQDPRRPEFCYRRDVDYVSGASIALRRELWEALGGFDELFVPAYAEDADLAFRVRARGLRTVVQPLSQLLHFEGISSGTDLGAGAKAYQVDNLRKLYERWKDVLATHRENADAPELEKERGVRGRVLFVDHCTPTPREDAGSMVAFETMAAFVAEGYKVTFIPEDNFAHMGAETRDLQRMGVEAVYHPAYPDMDRFLAERRDPFDVVFLHRFGVGEAHLERLRNHSPGARVLFLNADMHSLRELRQAELSGDAGALARAGRTREREFAVVRAADVTLVHSSYEQALLARELPEARVALYPLIHEPASSVPSLQGRSGVCFVGGFRHPPNADAIAWFADEVWPQVLARLPDARLHVVGSHMPPEVQALAERKGIVVEGFVPDLDAYLARRRASVAPLRYGAGAKGKVAGSLASGVPVACTGIAAEGMGLEEGEEVLVADDPEGLAAHVVSLLRDDAAWQRLSAGALAWAQRTTSRASARERLRRLLAD